MTTYLLKTSHKRGCSFVLIDTYEDLDLALRGQKHQIESCGAIKTIIEVTDGS